MTSRTKLHSGKRSPVVAEDFQVGSGNVFADLGLDHPDERLAKARLAAAINAIIEEKAWTQSEAAEHLDTHQPVISALRHGRLKSLSYERLVNWLVMLGRTVEIRVKPHATRRARTGWAEAAARLRAREEDGLLETPSPAFDAEEWEW